MDRRWLRRAALWTRRGAALGLLVGSARFGWAAVSWSLEHARAAPAVVNEESVERRERDLAQAGDQRAAEAPEPPQDAPPKAKAKAKAKGKEAKRRSARRSRDAEKRAVRTLFVDLGPPRSEVFVDGVRVGHTPYAGSWSCKAGDELRIHVLPRRGVPIESRAACRDSMRAVAGRNLDPDEVASLLGDPTLPSSVKDALRR